MFPNDKCKQNLMESTQYHGLQSLFLGVSIEIKAEFTLDLVFRVVIEPEINL